MSVSLAPLGGRLVGREAELARILSALEATIDGDSRLVLVSGEAGVGKTRLAQEVLSHTRARRLRAIVGRCFEQHTSVPFFPFTEALTTALAEAPMALQSDAPQRWPELAHVVPELGGGAPKLDTQETQLRIFQGATDLLHTLAKADPVVLLLEDLHWADSTSLALLLYLGRHLQAVPILILGTYREVEVGRQHPLEETLRELVRERLVDDVHIRRLRRDDTAVLISNQLAAERISDQLLTLVHGRGDGNPFFVEELLKALVEQGAVFETNGRWDCKQLSQIEVPHSIRSVVGQRVSRLAPGAQELLRLASVLGAEWDLDVLLAASGISESEVLDHLDAALAARLLEERHGGTPERYAFVHVLMQQSLYQELPSHRQRRLHRRVGEALEQVHTHNPVFAAELARNFLLAGDRERAAHYATAAGDQAAARYAHAEAAQQYEIALDLLDELRDALRAAEVRYRLANELYDLNRLADAIAAYEAALAEFARFGDALGQARVHGGLGRLHRGRYDFLQALPHFEAALRFWPYEREDAELAGLLLDFAGAKFYSVDYLSDVPLAERGLALAERLGDAGLIARALWLVSAMSFRRDARPQPAIDAYYQRAESLARQARDWRTLSRLYLSFAVYHWLLGELELARADRRRAVEAAERSGEAERVAFAYQALAISHFSGGDWKAGRDAARTGLGLDPQHLLLAMPGLAFLAWMEGSPEEAIDYQRRTLAAARQRGDLQGVAIGRVFMADWLLELSRPAEAEHSARDAVDMLRIGGTWQPWPGWGYPPLAEALALLGALDAEAILAEAEQQVEASQQYIGWPQLLRARGLIWERGAELDRAAGALQASADVARSQHAVIQLGRTLAVLVRVARRGADAALAARAEAELADIVEGIGPEVRRLPWASGLSRSPRRLSTPGVGPLTPREREVAVLVAGGLTNRQIAERLVISERTAEHHVQGILNKLGVASRSQVAAWVAHDRSAADTSP